MPALGMAQETGKLLQWLKSPGDSVTKGEPLMEIETDKTTVEIESPATGVLANVTAQVGDDVPVGQRIAIILAPGEFVPAIQAEPAPTAAQPSIPSTVRVTPVAQRIAAENNVDLSQVRL